ncbi:YwmB family TATA-box binding protein [Paraliobacillus ryukyuensis]|uniref:YwmB family TATA-box binding protein n=1 Tax=Paraliobacillus ryukyuensis TaxID=200904 RepID=UPI0009A6DCEE|nr:YwmB family TATA-box binding protein [Paraliobacillus ryukyuensis]
MKQKVIIITFILLSSVTFHLETLSAHHQVLAELKDLEKAFQANNHTIQQWQLQLREQVEVEKLTSTIKSIKQLFPVREMEVEYTNQAKKLKWNPQHSSSQSESIIIVVGKNSSKADVIYTLTGDTSLDKWVEESNVHALLKDIFTDKVTKFTCASTVLDDKMNSVYFLNRLQGFLNVQQVHKLRESDFTVLSGYTKKWDTSIPMENEQMNIQLAARQVDKEKTMITIGTPILTTEY